MAVFVLFVVGAMAALSIDVTTMYTARSEAQLVVDSAALAGARVLANSGATSDPNSATDGLMVLAQTLAKTVATQVAEQNKIGGNTVAGTNLTPAISFGGSWFNPTITVNAKVTNLPTFFARIWGRTTLAVAASATAEAYNPSGANNGALGQTATPVAPLCVKPWLLPNMDPSNPTYPPIFNSTTGAITTGSNLLGWSSTGTGGRPMSLSCPAGNCSTLPAPVAWQYYPGNNDATSFPEPTFSLPTCSGIGRPTAYEYSIAGCIQTPISCTSNNVNIDMANNRRLNRDTAEAVNCLTNAADGGDTVTTTPNQPIEFVAGAGSPAAVANPALIGQYVMVSDSLVTVPVFNSTTGVAPVNPVTIIGFVQLFLNPDGTQAPNTGNVNTTVINLVGCGTSAAGTPIILGNGVSPVAVRLITPSS